MSASPIILPPAHAIEGRLHQLYQNKIDRYFPDEGEFRRELYPKHCEFFRNGAIARERCFMAGNRMGKSEAGAYEATLHLTGRYPDWWEGRRFTDPVAGWVAGDTNQTVRDILQAKLLGKLLPDGDARPDDIIGLGTGMIPGESIRATKKRSGGADAIEMAWIRHISGGTSLLGFKSYEQGRKAFQGTSQDFIWLDEECPIEIYTECLLRTLTTDGLVWLTFTPLMGLTELVLEFLPGGRPEVNE
jgi:phage terminase large subunit-like protein